MRKLFIGIFYLFCSGIELAAETPDAPEQYAPAAGKTHTDFLLPSIQDRQPISLRSFRGRKLLLLHFASW